MRREQLDMVDDFISLFRYHHSRDFTVTQAAKMARVNNMTARHILRILEGLSFIIRNNDKPRRIVRWRLKQAM